MVKVVGPCLSLDAQGSLKNSITYQRRPSGSAVYQKSEPGAREPFSYSPAQLTQRLSVQSLVSAWRNLDVNYKNQWDDLAKEMGMIGTGYHAYMQLKGINPEMVNVVDFDGINDYVRTVNNPFTQSQFANGSTLECWGSVDTFDDIAQSLIDLEARMYLSIQATTDKVQFGIYDGVTNLAVSDDALSPAQYYYFAGVWGGGIGGTVTLYVNAVPQATTDTSNAPLIDAVTRPFAIGAAGYDPPVPIPFDGKIVEVRVWNKGLDVKDIVIHGKNFRDVSCENTDPCSYDSNCLIHWTMKEGSGTILNDIGSSKLNGSFKAAGEPAWKQNNLFKDIYSL